ncbi:MAG: GTPase Era [Deltaproteobacteria bacterium]|nr:GTPase Era [Deltaproteobacteria bacterium]
MSRSFKSGYIAIVGRPNVGKSTLLNAFLGQKIAAVCDKPQTTRHRILGIKTTAEGQMLFVDMPGIHRPHKSLNEYMMDVARAALDEVDLFLFVVEPSKKTLHNDHQVFEMIQHRKKPIFLVINKTDHTSRDALLPIIESYHQEFHPDEIFPISATRQKGLEALEKEILKKLPEGPLYFPEDQVSDLPDRFIVAEMIREKITALTREEVPYSVTVQIESYQEPKEGDSKKLVRIQAAIIVEKDSQKGILIGKKGEMIKKIGTEARIEVEKHLGLKVFLELFVRVEENWTKDPKKVKELAY